MVKECRYFTWTQFEHPSFSLLAFYWLCNLVDKNIFLKRLQTIYYKLWEKSGFHASSPWIIDLGPTHVTQVARSSYRIAWASRSTLDLLTVHFKEQKEIGIVHGSLRFFKDIIHWAGGFNTDKKRSFEKYIMTHHGINIRKIPRNGTYIVRYIDFSDGSGSLGSLNTCIAWIKMLRNSRLVITLFQS